MGATAKITLIKCLSSTKLGTRFEQNKTMYISRPELIASCQIDGDFVVNMVEEDKKPAGKPNKPGKPAASKPEVSKEEEAAKILG